MSKQQASYKCAQLFHKMTLILELHQLKPKSIAPMIERQQRRARDGDWSWRRPRPRPPLPPSPSAWPRPWCKSVPPTRSLSCSFSARSKLRKVIWCIQKKDKPALCWHLERLLGVSQRRRWVRSSSSSPSRWPCCACASWWSGSAGAGSSFAPPSPSSSHPVASCMPPLATPEKGSFRLKCKHCVPPSHALMFTTCNIFYNLSLSNVFASVSMLQLSNVFQIAMWLFNQYSREWDVWGMMGI